MKIFIDNVEIKTILEGLTWSGSKDEVSRSVSFQYIYNENLKDLPIYKTKCGSMVKIFDDNDKSLFSGMVYTVNGSENENSITVMARDLLNNMLRSKFVGRYRGTVKQIADEICSLFGIINAIENNDMLHNIVSKGDLTYYDVLNNICKSQFGDNFNLYLDGENNLKLLVPVHTDDGFETAAILEVGKNVLSSKYASSIENMVNKMLIISSEGALISSVENINDIAEFGLFQNTYSYNKDSKDNIVNAKLELLSIENSSSFTAFGDNSVISGKIVEIIDKKKNAKGYFQIISDSHTFGITNLMDVGVRQII